MTNRHKNSIQFRIWLNFMFYAAIVIGGLWLLQIVFINSYYTGMKEQNILGAAEVVGTTAENTSLSDDARDDALYAVASKYDVSITLVDGTTGELTSYSAAPAGLSDELRNALKNKVRPFLSSDMVSSLKTELSAQSNGTMLKYYQGNDMIVYGRVLDTKDGSIMLVASKLQRLDDIIRILSSQLVYITIGLLALSVAMSIIIANRVARPLKKITQKAQLLSEGNLDVTFEEGTRGSYVEIDRLAHTLNYATDGLQQVEKLRAELIANVSHDLRTPLTMIKAYAEMIRDISGNDEEKRNKHLEIIIQESDRLTALVQDLLDVSKMQAGVMSYEPSSFDMTALVNKVLTRLDIICEKRGITISLYAKKSMMVFGDYNKIQQVVYNLVTNAINYSGDSNQINVFIEEDEDDLVRFSVQDFGEGIDEENIPYIWDRYYKVDKEHKRSVAGTGIGLSIVKSALEMHGSEYGVDSKKGEGSTFWFKLKRSEEGGDDK